MISPQRTRHGVEQDEMKVSEYFLTFVLVEKSSGETLTRCRSDILGKCGLEARSLRGQDYNNNINMEGQRAGASHKWNLSP